MSAEHQRRCSARASSSWLFHHISHKKEREDPSGPLSSELSRLKCYCWLLAGLQRFRIPFELSRRRSLRQGQNLTAFLFSQARLAPRSFTHPQTIDPFRIEALQVNAHGSRVTEERESNLLRSLAFS